MNATFTYSCTTYTRTSVISRARAEALADALPRDALHSPCGYPAGAPGYFLHVAGVSTFSDVTYGANGSRRLAAQPGVDRYHYSPEQFALVDGLPNGWVIDVRQVLDERARAAHAAAMLDAAAHFDTTPAIRARLIAEAGGRYFRAPEVRDLSRLLQPVRAYPAPSGACTARLQLRAAVSYAYEQASYADHSRYLIPVAGAIGDLAACRQNLASWAEAIRTHTGMAGSGCSYSATLVVTDDGAYVHLDQRASISD